MFAPPLTPVPINNVVPPSANALVSSLLACITIILFHCFVKFCPDNLNALAAMPAVLYPPVTALVKTSSYNPAVLINPAILIVEIIYYFNFL